MPRFTFQRRLRTLASEQYNLYDAESEQSQRAVGQVDAHFIGTHDAEVVVLLFNEYDADDIEELLATLDDDLMNIPMAENASVRATVFYGQELGSYELDRGDSGDDDEMPDESQLV